MSFPNALCRSITQDVQHRMDESMLKGQLFLLLNRGEHLLQIYSRVIFMYFYERLNIQHKAFFTLS